jgi:hypothetical protein
MKTAPLSRNFTKITISWVIAFARYFNHLRKSAEVRKVKRLNKNDNSICGKFAIKTPIAIIVDNTKKAMSIIKTDQNFNIGNHFVFTKR